MIEFIMLITINDVKGVGMGNSMVQTEWGCVATQSTKKHNECLLNIFYSFILNLQIPSVVKCLRRSREHFTHWKSGNSE